MDFEYPQKMQDNQSFGKTASTGSKLFLTLFFLFFFGMGSIFEVFIIRELVRNVQSRSWPEVSCRILESAVREDSRDNSPYKFAVKYQYIYQNKTYQSERCKLQATNFSDYSKAQKLAEAYPAGSQTICYVNPQKPDEAILKHSSPWFAFMIIIPTIFVLIGGGGIYFTWFDKSRDNSNVSEAVQTAGGKQMGKRGQILFGLIFAAVGLVFSYMLLVRPLEWYFEARNWNETPCKVISANVRSHEDNDNHGTTYSIDILYEYTAGGKAYRSNRYDFIGGSSSGYNGKNKVVNNYRQMKNPVCYVDPKDPAMAVLVRELTPKYAIGLIGLIFVAAGLVLVIKAIRGKSFESGKTTSVINTNQGCEDTKIEE
jgi:hypothetical protein